MKNSPHGVRAEPRDLRVKGSPGLPQRHDEGAKRFPVATKYGSRLHRAEPKVEVQTTPTSIKTDVSRNVRADDNSVLTQRLSAGSDIGRSNRAGRKYAERRRVQAGKYDPSNVAPRPSMIVPPAMAPNCSSSANKHSVPIDSSWHASASCNSSRNSSARVERLVLSK